MASLLGRAVLAVTGRKTVRDIFTESRPGRALSTRFVAGETLDEAIAACREANRSGASVSLDHLGEHVHHSDAAIAACEDYLAAIERLAEEGIDGNISVKLTQLGMGLDDGLAASSLARLAAAAKDHGITVTVDMEESAYVDVTMEIYEKAQVAYGNVGLAVQAYLFRTREDVERLIPLGGHLRLCKGAYAEPPELAYQRKDEVDASFDRLLERLMGDDRVTPAVATHDDQRIALATQLAAGRAAPWEFQMLYGVRTPLQRQLVRDGHPLRVYVPYGVAWYPYLTRRLAERPANLWFFMRAVMARG